MGNYEYFSVEKRHDAEMNKGKKISPFLRFKKRKSSTLKGNNYKRA